jgi:hypothetical protein
MNDNIPLAEDMLNGAGEIAAFIYGSSRLRRRVYHLAEKRVLPVFRLGSTLCARRSVLTAWIVAQEQQSGQNASPVAAA